MVNVGPKNPELNAAGVMPGYEDPSDPRAQELQPGATSSTAYDAAREKAGVDLERAKGDEQTIITAGQSVVVMGRNPELIKSEQ